MRTVDFISSVIGSQGQDSREGNTLDLLHSYHSPSQLISSFTMSLGPQTLELSLTLLFLSCWLCFRMECNSGPIASPHPCHLSQSRVPPGLWQSCLSSTLSPQSIRKSSSAYHAWPHVCTCTGRKDCLQGERAILCSRQADFFQRKRTKNKSKNKELRDETSKSEMW